jgi:hypothetical protein
MYLYVIVRYRTMLRKLVELVDALMHDKTLSLKN